MATMPSVYEFKYKTASSDVFATPLLGIGNSPYLFNGIDYDGLEITLKPGTSFTVESPSIILKTADATTCTFDTTKVDFSTSEFKWTGTTLNLNGATLNLKGNVINIEGKDGTYSKLVYKSSSYDTISVLCPTTTIHSVSKWYGSATLGEQVGARIIAGSCILKGATDTEPGEAVAAIGAHNFDTGGSATWEDLYIQVDGAKDVYIGKGSVGWGKQDGALKISNNADSRGVYVNTGLDSDTPAWKEVATKEYVDAQTTTSSNFRLYKQTLSCTVDKFYTTGGGSTGNTYRPLKLFFQVSLISKTSNGLTYQERFQKAVSIIGWEEGYEDKAVSLIVDALWEDDPWFISFLNASSLQSSLSDLTTFPLGKGTFYKGDGTSYNASWNVEKSLHYTI